MEPAQGAAYRSFRSISARQLHSFSSNTSAFCCISEQVTRYDGPSVPPPDSRRGGHLGAQLADAGWHCSWCFPTFADFRSKAASYSHVEHNTEDVLHREWLQRAVCEGRDLAGRWGEFRHWADMIRHLPGEFVRQRSVVGLPPPLLSTAWRVRFGPMWEYLLPGHCLRRDYVGSYKPL